MHITWVGCGIERRHGQASQPLERSLLEFKNVRCHKDAAGEKIKKNIIFSYRKEILAKKTTAAPVLKVYAHGAHVRGTKASWGDQKAGGLENLLALRAEGTRVSS